MTQSVLSHVAQALRQQCCHTGADSLRTRMSDTAPANLMSEEQWIDFVLSQRGTDHVADFFSTNFDREVLYWFVNKPLADNSKCFTVLHVEARDKRYDVLLLLLRLGASPNVTDTDLQTPVHFAAIHTSPVCLQALLEWGGDLYQQNKDGRSPLDYVTASSLMQHYDSSGGMQQIARLHPIILNKEKSFDDFKKAYIQLPSHQRPLCLKSVLSNQTLLFRACKAGWTDVVTFLLSQTDQVPPVNTTSNETPLHAACEGNHYDIVVELINKFPELLLMKDKLPYRGWYPIHTACAFGASDKILAEVLIGTMKLCIDFPHKFTNITFTDLCGQSPLYIAVTCGNLSHVSMYLHPLLVDTFLQVAPSLVAVNTSNIPTKCSVIHNAVLGGNNEIVRMLLDSFPHAIMAMAYPCKMTMGIMLEYFGHCLNSYSPLPVICERGSGELAVVPYDEVSFLDKPFKDLSLSPLAVACALGRTEIATALLEEASEIKTGLALQIALFMKHDDIVLKLLFHKSTRFIADNSNLTYFHISSVTEKHMIQCTEIDLQKNSLTNLPLSFFQAPLLKRLNVSFNNLNALPVGEQDEYSSGLSKWDWICKNLEILDIDHNAIHTLPEVVWTIPKLKWLNASHNCLVNISSSVQCSPSLHSIDVSHNQLTEVPSVLFASEEVNLSFNCLVSLPVDLWQSKIIKKLNVSNNCIAKLIFSDPNASSFIASLSFANIGTQISNHDNDSNSEQLDSFSSLAKLNLSHNALECFPIGLVCFVTHLQHLDVSFNQFTALDISMLPPYLVHFSAKKCGIMRFGITVDDTDSQKDTVRQRCFASAVKTSCPPAKTSCPPVQTSCPHRVHRTLQYLTSLNLSGNKLTDMQFVRDGSVVPLYPELRSLDLSSNELCGNFPANIQLQSCLGSLNLSDNPHLESIPMQLSLLNESLFDLRLANMHKLRDPPYEYHDMPTQSILSYMKLRLQKSVKHRCLRVMVFGHAKTGKSTLVSRLTSKRVQTTQWISVTTHSQALNIVKWVYAPYSASEHIRFIMWDFDNQDVFNVTHHYFYSQQGLYLVVFNLLDDKKGVQDLDALLKNIKVHAPGCPVIIVGTHLDQVSCKNTICLKKLVDKLYGDSSTYPIIAAVTFLSSASQKLTRRNDVNELRKEIYYVATHLFPVRNTVAYQPKKSPDDPSALLQQMVPESYLELEQDILTKAAEMRASNTVPVLGLREFCSCIMPSWTSESDMKKAFQFLHSKGTLLYYFDHWEKQIFCIDIQWLCNAIANILRIPEVNKGIIPENLFFQSCKPFLCSQHSKCLELLTVYDIVMKLGGSSYFIPALLPRTISHLPRSFSTGSTAIHKGNEHHQTHLIGKESEHIFQDNVDDQHSSDEDDNADYIIDLVDRVSKGGQYMNGRVNSIGNSGIVDRVSKGGQYMNGRVNSIGNSGIVDRVSKSGQYMNSRVNSIDNSGIDEHVSKGSQCMNGRVNSIVNNDKEQTGLYKVSVACHKVHSLPSGNNFYNVDLLDSSSFEKSTVLASPQDNKETHVPVLRSKSIEATFYPILCRIWFSPFIPDGFWPRLLSRIISDDEINDVLLKLLPTVQFSCSQKYSLWTLWQSGVAIILNNIALLELKRETNFTMNDDNNLVIQYEKYRIFLSINTNEFALLHGADQECSLSHQEVLSLTTKLLVLIEQLLLELDEWFPGTLEEASSGQVMSYVPCYHCIHGGQETMQFSYTEHIALYHSDLNHNIHCFSLKQMLQLYSDNNKSPICQRHGRMFIEYCVPDIVFKDLQNVVCGPDIPLCIDKDQMLGRGGSAFVLRGEMMNPRQLVAVKVMADLPMKTQTITDYLDNYTASLQVYRMIRKEVSFLSTLHHENLTQLCGVSTSPFMLLIELAPLGSLRTIIKEYRAADMALASSVLCQSMAQIASALAFLHQKHVIYFDLKSDNVLVWKFPLPSFSKVADQDVLLKITDYGISRVSSTGYEIRTSTVSGTPGYIAPEVLLGRNTLQADKIDVFSYGMTVYELISLQVPFEKLCKINPDANVNVCVTKSKRPTLPIKGVWSPYLAQKVMNLCWDHDPKKRPKISQVVEWCNLTVFKALRAVYHLENGKLGAICQCQVDRTHVHASDASTVDTSKVKFIIEPSGEDDIPFSFPLLPIIPFQSAGAEEENTFNFEVKNSRQYSQIWIAKRIDSRKSVLQIFSYKSSQAGCQMFSTSIKTADVLFMVNVDQYMWIYTAEKILYVVHMPTMQNISCFSLENNKLSLIEMLHVPEWQVVVVLWKSQLWFIDDESIDGLHVMDVIKLDKRDPVIHMCVVNLLDRTEVWASQGDRKITIFTSSSNGLHNKETLYCTVENKSFFSYLIVCLRFTSTISGNTMVHVWVSFNQRPHLVCWDAKSRIQINCIKLKEGNTSSVSSLLDHENQLYVGTSSGNIEVYDSEKGVLLQQYSVHDKKVRRMLKLPSEIHQCVCAELFPRVNSNSEHDNLPDTNTCVTPRKRSVQEYALQKRKSYSDLQLQYTAPLIVSIGDGVANWLNMENAKEQVNLKPELLTWTGYGLVKPHVRH